MVALMSKAFSIVAFLGVELVSGAKKCSWSPGSLRCNFDLTKTGIDYKGKLGEFVSISKKREACFAKSGTSSECANDANCVYNPDTNKCSYKKPHEFYRSSYGVSDGCNKETSYYLTGDAGCESKLSEGECPATENCVWKANSDYNANAASVEKYDDDSKKCLETKASRGKCALDKGLLLCGQKVSMDGSKKYRECEWTLWGDDKNENNMLTCLQEKSNCSSIKTSAVAKILVKESSNRTAQDEYDIAVADRSCAIELSCEEYVDNFMLAPRLEDFPRADCYSLKDSSACFANPKCIWLYGSCNRIMDMRRVKFGDDTCGRQKLQKLSGSYFDSDEAMVSAARDRSTKSEVCNNFNTKADCEADTTKSCRFSSDVTMTCSGGVSNASSTRGECNYNSMTRETEAEMNNIRFGAGVVTNDVYAISDSCEALTTEAACNNEELSTTEKGQLEAASKAAEAAASTSTKTASTSARSAAISLTVFLSTLLVGLLSA